MNINELCKAAHENAVAKGFYEDRRDNIAEKLMLIVSELAEALEADRKGRHTFLFTFPYGKAPENFDKYVPKDDTFFEQAIKDTFEDELADAVIRIFDLAGFLNINLEEHICRKMDYNSRREKRHGKAY
jgi:NTP pyrophosphatase (non-canonical NTP hydrolase)